jgi:hypothetical protein
MGESCKLQLTGGGMKTNIIKLISDKFFDLLNSAWSTINQLPAGGKFKAPKETPYQQEHPWDKKKKTQKKSTPRDQIHNEWPLGSERNESKRFNKLRR